MLSGTGCGLNGTCCLGLAAGSVGRVVWDWLRAQWDVLTGTGCGLNGCLYGANLEVCGVSNARVNVCAIHHRGMHRTLGREVPIMHKGMDS